MALIGSITEAMRVQDILAHTAIPTTVIKNEGGNGLGRGCIYGISFSCNQIGNIKTVFAAHKIKVKKWIEGN